MPSLTKKALARQLKDMMQHRPLDKITVKELVEACGLNRQTFYYHFQDIYDLLAWIYRTEALQAIENSKSATTWQQGLSLILHYVKDNELFCLNTFRSLGREHLERFLESVTLKLLGDVADEITGNRHISKEDRNFVVRFYSHAFLGVLEDWLKEGLNQDPQVISDNMSLLLEGHFTEAVSRFEKR